MSEYQWVEFRAVDAPLDDEALEFMHQQSTRAEISKWHFTNEYNFGDFRGNVREMMRRGYDVHVHYGNFGHRRIYFRIPDKTITIAQIAPYLLEDQQIDWLSDDEGTGGLLIIDPEGDAGTFDWLPDVESFASDLIPIREMIIAGDFRAIYLAHIAFNYDDEANEPPVPAGLGAAHRALERFCEYYEIDSDLVSVAAELSRDLGAEESRESVIRAWLQDKTIDQLSSDLEQCLHNPTSYPSKLLRMILRESVPRGAAHAGSRTIEFLRLRVNEINAERERQRKAAQAKEAERRKAEEERALKKTPAKIADEPEECIARIDAAIEERSRPAYQRAVEELSLMAQACGKSNAEAKAKSIRQQYSARSALISELKKAGF